uniref:Ger(x)C family spore germination C-terminal domain-containing protein n=1 Tax=Paenibacillus sp. FSL K6-3182 TaxID=2921495 RepID=UPI00403F84F0
MFIIVFYSLNLPKDLLIHSLHKFQKQVKVDIFGFGSALHRSNPKMWHGIKDWDKTFENVNITHQQED